MLFDPNIRQGPNSGPNDNKNPLPGPRTVLLPFHHGYDDGGLSLVGGNGTFRAMTDNEKADIFKRYPSVRGIFHGRDGLIFRLRTSMPPDKFPLTMGGRPLRITEDLFLLISKPFPRVLAGMKRDRILCREACSTIRTMTGLPEAVIQGVFLEFPTCTAILRLRNDVFLEMTGQMPIPHERPALIAGLMANYSSIPLLDGKEEAALKTPLDLEASVEERTNLVHSSRQGYESQTTRGSLQAPVWLSGIAM
ncbi:hypothetical protein TWF696_003075 [Orbilia brochopaga]|uniref:Uncharacterized protein n=1 Tax=Orbilia brochopaga TaxID=3140254 RepID=A0AAV9U342_9PEZI